MLKRAIYFIVVLALSAPTLGQETSALLTDLEARGLMVDQIIIKRHSVFENNTRNQNSRIKQLVNRFHIVTKEEIIRSQLVFQSGEPIKKFLIEESERILRRNKYLYSATISPINIREQQTDLLVETKDVWTLSPELDFNRSGSENFYTVGIEDDNLLGTGASLTLSRSKTLERSSNLILYSNNNFLTKRLRFALGVVDSDDGNSYSFSLQKPFFSLNTKRAYGVSLSDTDSIRFFYRAGEDIGEYRASYKRFNMFGGWSRGRNAGWVRRINVGIFGEQSNFDSTDDDSRNIGVPENRELLYPYVSIDFLEDKFVTTKNFRNISRTEDIFLGSQLGLLFGYSSTALGSDRNALIVSGNYRYSLGDPEHSLLALTSDFSTRIESGDWNNFLGRLNLNWSYKQTDHWRFYAGLDLLHGENLDFDNLTTLGGSTGMRGFPNRYRNGSGRGVLTIEQRYFSDWYPFGIFRVGGAVFLDVGQVWGENAIGETNDDLLSNAGVGLRLANTRGGGNKIVHIDLAFPIDASTNIDEVQLTVEAKREF